MGSAVESIRDSGVKIFVAATGAGAGIQNDLWQVPGISKVLVGCQFPYAAEQTEEFLGFKPEKFVSEDTAIELASAAYMRAKAVAGVNGKAVGLGLTASTSTNYDKRSPNQIYAAVVGDTGCYVAHTELHTYVDNELSVRNSHGQECDSFGLGLLQYAIIGTDSVRWSRRPGTEPKACDERVKELAMARPVFMPSGQRCGSFSLPVVVAFPGSFNPPHEGHHHMASEVEFWHSVNVVYQINIDSPHKGTLTGVEILARAAYFRADRFKAPRALKFTVEQPLFTDKVKYGGSFDLVMGADTLERVLDPKWGPSTEEVLATFERFGVKIYLFDRFVKEGDSERSIEAQEVVSNLPEKYRLPSIGMFEYMGRSKSVSSTDIRNAK